MHDPSKVVNNATDLVPHGSTHLHASEAVRFQETGAAAGVAKTMRVESLDAGLLCYGEPTAFPTTAGTAVSEPFGLPDLSKGAVTILEFPSPWRTEHSTVSLSLCPRGGEWSTVLFPFPLFPWWRTEHSTVSLSLCPPWRTQDEAHHWRPLEVALNYPISADIAQLLNFYDVILRIGGASWNLWNNVWGTNYPQWYPFNDVDANIEFRFAFNFTLGPSSPQ